MLRKLGVPFILILAMFFGPGTWGIFLLYRKRVFKYRDWFAWMYIYNFAAAMLFVIIGLAWLILEISKLFE